jgi:hypothetical protein
MLNNTSSSLRPISPRPCRLVQSLVKAFHDLSDALCDAKRGARDYAECHVYILVLVTACNRCEDR